MKRNWWKRWLALGLSAALVCVSAACQSKGSGETDKASTSASSAPKEKGSAPRETVPAGDSTSPQTPQYPPYVTEPVTIEVWHTMGSGANGEHMEEAIAAFNASNPYKITVEGTYQGNYENVFSQVSTAFTAGDTPEICVLSSNGITMFAKEGILADLTEYVARDQVDMDNIATGMTNLTYYEDQMISMPFVRSTAVFVYNKALWEGIELPVSMEDLMEKAANISGENPGVYGYGVIIDPYFLQEPLMMSLGGCLLTEDGNGPGGLDDGTFVKMMTDWLTGIEEGWCFPPAVTSASDTQKQLFYSGQLASMVVSCGGLRDIIRYSQEAGIDLGVSYVPVYGGYGCVGGGGNMCIVGRDHSQQEIAAAWEFVKFLMSDEWAAKRAIATGYLPITKTSTQTEEIQNLWKEYPQFKVAFEQLDYSQITTWSPYRSEYRTYLVQAMSYVIQDFSMTPEEAAQYLKEQARIIFPQ